MTTEQMKELNLQRARKVAFECMMEYGVNQTTHEMLAKKVGLGLRTLRRYFPTKVDLVCDVMKTVGSKRYHKMWENIMKAVSPKSCGLEQLQQMLYQLFELCKNGRSPFLLTSELELFAYENHVTAEILGLYLKTIQSSRKYLKQIIKKGIADGSIHSDIDLDAYTILLTNSYVGMLQRMEAVRYTKTDYNLASMKEQVDLYIKLTMDTMALGNRKI